MEGISIDDQTKIIMLESQRVQLIKDKANAEQRAADVRRQIEQDNNRPENTYEYRKLKT